MLARGAGIVLVVLIFGLFMAPAAGRAGTVEEPTGEDRCPVCGMFVLPYPNWLASATFADGSRYFFDGPKDLFKFLAEPATYRPGISTTNLVAGRVTEYYTLQSLDVHEVFFVTGSDVLGPMGNELVPVAGTEALRTFVRDHGHEEILRFAGRDLVPVDPLP